jgi:hypothetical protein
MIDKIDNVSIEGTITLYCFLDYDPIELKEYFSAKQRRDIIMTWKEKHRQKKGLYYLISPKK